MKFEDMIDTIQFGDCYKLIKDIPDNSIDLVYIDIPYFIKGMVKSDGTIRKLSGFTKDNEKRREGRNKVYQSVGSISNGIDYSILDELCRVMKYIYIYIWCSKEQILDLMKYFVEEKECLFEILVWCKTNPSPFTNQTFLSDIEYCLLFREKGNTRLNDGIKLKSKWYLSATNQTDKKHWNHPTIKPLNLVERHILHSSNENDIVLDCFCGSGTTCVACKNTNRRFIGMEINKEYYDIAVKRLNNEDNNGQMSLFTV